MVLELGEQISKPCLLIRVKVSLCVSAKREIFLKKIRLHLIIYERTRTNHRVYYKSA
jgi:hypothetical protein